MAVEGGPDIVDSGLALAFDGANVRSFRGVPTTNAISNADTMASWTLYYRTTAASTFTTEFGTTGYRFTNQPSWNGIYRNFNLGSSGNYTFSAWFRYNGGSSNNNGATVYVSNYGGGDTVVGVDKGLIGVWQRISHTVNVTSPSNVSFYLISYGGTDNGTGNPDYSSWEVTMPQIEAGTTLTPFVNGTRGTTNATGGGWVDLGGNGNHGELVNGPTYNSSNQGTIVFDGTNDYVNIPSFSSKPTTAMTCEAWIKPTTPTLSGTIRGGAISSTNSMYLGIINSVDGGNTHAMHWAVQTSNSRLYNWNGSIPNNQWSHLLGTYDGTTSRAYLNGVQIDSWAQTGTITDATYVVGTYGGALTDGVHNFNGQIAIARIYNKALSASEVLQNFNAQRKRFGV
jgi:hypothetical protein